MKYWSTATFSVPVILNRTYFNISIVDSMEQIEIGLNVLLKDTYKRNLGIESVYFIRIQIQLHQLRLKISVWKTTILKMPEVLQTILEFHGIIKLT
jgi:hypothetical protein